MRAKATLILLTFTLLVVSCERSYTPKPKGYFRIALPGKVFSRYDASPCAYSFNLPQYSVVANYEDSIAQPCWKYIRFPKFNAEVFLSYKEINGNLATYIEDSRTLVYKHSVKADAINETVYSKPGESYGVLYDIKGNAASPTQFFITDSTKNFIRGALYFNMPPQPDSLEPVINFIRKDIVEIMESVQWKR